MNTEDKFVPQHISDDMTEAERDEIWNEWKKAGYRDEDIEYYSKATFYWTPCSVSNFTHAISPLPTYRYRVKWDILMSKDEASTSPVTDQPVQPWLRTTKPSDPVDHPSHYTSHPSGIECKDIIGHYHYFVGAAIKYLWRGGKKGDIIEDYRKAIKCIEIEIERLEADNG